MTLRPWEREMKEKENLLLKKMNWVRRGVFLGVTPSPSQRLVCGLWHGDETSSLSLWPYKILKVFPLWIRLIGFKFIMKVYLWPLKLQFDKELLKIHLTVFDWSFHHHESFAEIAENWLKASHWWRMWELRKKVCKRTFVDLNFSDAYVHVI